MRSDLMPILDCLPETRPQFPDLQLCEEAIFGRRILFRADEQRGLDAVLVNTVYALGNIASGVVDVMRNHRASIVEVFRFSYEAYGGRSGGPCRGCPGQ